ncbi:MAG: hypothetical protein Q9214_006875, partial [Letrouitia sp. 1 TL-2023]
THSPDYHHPKTHYIFSSDSPDSHLLTSAALSSFPASSDNPSTPHPNERYLILDLDATGSKVVKASSMSPDWQITSAEILPAPTWEGEEEGGRGMMLRVEGIEVGQEGEKEGKAEEGAEGMEVLVERFERRMGELRRVVEGGGVK